MGETPESAEKPKMEQNRRILIGAAAVVAVVVLGFILYTVIYPGGDDIDSLEMTQAEIDTLVSEAVSPYDPEGNPDAAGIVILHKIGTVRRSGGEECVVQAAEYGDTYCYTDDWLVEIEVTEAFNWLCGSDVGQFSAVVRRGLPTADTRYDVLHVIEPVSYEELVAAVEPLEEFADRCITITEPTAEPESEQPEE
jgi:hypothetical protein